MRCVSEEGLHRFLVERPLTFAGRRMNRLRALRLLLDVELVDAHWDTNSGSAKRCALCLHHNDVSTSIYVET